MIVKELSQLTGDALDAKRRDWSEKLAGNFNYEAKNRAFAGALGGNTVYKLKNTKSDDWLFDLVEDNDPQDPASSQCRNSYKMDTDTVAN
jgi:hypothetical protein